MVRYEENNVFSPNRFLENDLAIFFLLKFSKMLSMSQIPGMNKFPFKCLVFDQLHKHLKIKSHYRQLHLCQL